jgi:hypothetical protein
MAKKPQYGTWISNHAVATEMKKPPRPATGAGSGGGVEESEKVVFWSDC